MTAAGPGRDPRYDLLFEPLRIGPVTARNRFYQAPHCNGMGRNYPTPMAVMRGIKAEGGWSVVCTEQCDIHYSTDNPRNVRLWDEGDIPALARMADAVHEHDSLAGILLAHNGYITPNSISREIPLSPSGGTAFGMYPVHTRAMDKSDIAAFRRWHRNAALNARKAGFDLVIVYAGHDLALPMHFISRRHNSRTDEYGGPLENRARLLRELIEDTKEAVGDTCAVGVRLSVDELLGDQGITCEGEGREVVEMLAELPDLWDVNISRWQNDSATSRFQAEGYQERYVSFVKQVTTKPVVGVGRFTSPDTMASQIRRGILDMIGAARPSIADPFLPRKIEEGRTDDIRECIGCNICVSGNYMMAPIRCTQNPTMGEEWRRGWHPERIPPKDTDDRVLILGAGPAGLEAACALGQRGYEVVLAEAGRELGGRVARESRLPGLAAWARVRDHRLHRLQGMPNVEVYLESELGAGDVREAECSLVAIATGARWRRDGIGRHLREPVPGSESARVLTPDDIMDGVAAEGPVVIYDDDHYYMSGVLAEKLRAEGHAVTIVTPAASVADFTQYTLELNHIRRRLFEIGVEIVPFHALASVGEGTVDLASIFTGAVKTVECRSTVMVSAPLPSTALHDALAADAAALERAGIRRVVAIGDCRGPGTIAAAVFSGHAFARELNVGLQDEAPFLRENVELHPTLHGPE